MGGAAGRGPRQEAVRGPGVGDAVAVHPAALRLLHAPLQPLEVGDVVGVRVDQDDHVPGTCPPQHVVACVEPVQAAVDLDGGAGALRGSQHRVQVQLDAGPAADHASAEVADHVHRGILHGADDAPGLGGAVQLERRVHRRHAPVERGAEGGVVVEAAVGADVQLHAVQQAQAAVHAVEGTQLGTLREQPLAAHPVQAQVLAVVGDRQVGEAALRRRRGHVGQRAAAVPGGVGVQVQIAAQVPQHRRRRQLAARGRLDLTVVLAQRRRDRRQVQRGVDLPFRGGRDQSSVLVPQTVFVEPPAAGAGEPAQLDVVRLRAGEVQGRRPELVRAHHAQVHLQAASGDPGGTGVASVAGVAGSRGTQQRQRREVLHHRARLAGGHQQVQVGYGGPQPPQAAAVAHPLHRRQLGQRCHQESRVGQRLGDRQPQLLAGRADPPQPADQRLLGPGAQSRKVAHQVLLQGLLQLVETLDAELLPQPNQGLGTQPRHPGELLHRRREPLAEMLQLGDAAAGEELAHLARDRLADAVEPQQFRLRQRRQVLRRVTQPAQGAVVGAGAERLRAAVVQDGQAVQLRELGQQLLHLQRSLRVCWLQVPAHAATIGACRPTDKLRLPEPGSAVAGRGGGRRPAAGAASGPACAVPRGCRNWRGERRA